MNGRVARVATACAAVAGLLAIGARLTPPYLKDWKLQSYLNQLVEEPATAEETPAAIGALVYGRASSLGIPLQLNDVQVERRDTKLHIKAVYLVRVDMALYSVDLHFRPEAGGA